MVIIIIANRLVGWLVGLDDTGHFIFDGENIKIQNVDNISFG